MGHERRLRWDEVRIFAVYNAQGIKKSAFAQTYELSNEQTVVRWGQQVFANPLLVVQSSVHKGEDFNWLVGQINTLVAARTGLPLLDFSDRSTVRSPAFQTRNASIPAREQPEEVHSLAPIPIARHDPLFKRVQLRGEAGVALALLSAFSFVAIVAGLIAKLSNNGGSVSGVFSGGFANFLLVFGAIMLVVLLLRWPSYSLLNATGNVLLSCARKLCSNQNVSYRVCSQRRTWSCRNHQAFASIPDAP
ncbi:MAG: hypothetical protein ACYDER_14235 [Ktedonobacteraceae bacterium]